MTVLFGQLNPKNGVLQLASAGHPAPFLIRRDTVERPLLMTEPAIGVELSAALDPYPSEVLAMSRGDLLVLFTDGIAELRDGEDRVFEEHMAEVLAGRHGDKAADVVAELLTAVKRFTARPPADDLAVLCVGLTA